jgi:hypothetical protein
MCAYRAARRAQGRRPARSRGTGSRAQAGRGPGAGTRVPVAVALPAVDQVGHEPLHAAAVHVVTAAHISCFRR